MSFDYGLFIKSGHFSDGKSSGSIREIRIFNPFHQINITNQPTGYNHIQINTAKDLSLLVRDIFNYNKYFCQYEEQLKQYDLLKSQLKNLQSDYSQVQPESLNLKYKKGYFHRLYLNFFYRVGTLARSNVTKNQLPKLISDLEDYFKEREEFVKKYGNDILLGMECFISLDELHLFFGSRAWKENFQGEEGQALIELITFPVKMKTRIDGIVQNPGKLDKNFRDQSSLYIKHRAKFFDLIMHTYYYDVKDSGNPELSDDEIVKKRMRINWYKLSGGRFGVIQYRRENFIDLSKNHCYTPGLFFEHIRMMTDIWNAHTQKKKNIKEEKKEEKEKPTL